MPYIFPACYGMRQIVNGCVEFLHIRFAISKENVLIVILRDRSHSDIFDKSKVILKPFGFSDILFAIKLPKAISLVARQIQLRSNITRRKANKTGVVSLRIQPLRYTSPFLLYKTHCKSSASAAPMPPEITIFRIRIAITRRRL